MTKSKRKKMRGTVQRVLKPFLPSELEKVQISVDEAEELYREIRIENVLTDENGEKVQLKPGAEVDVVVEADINATTKKPSG
jgi:predicted DNA-binding antitoxin AbrB/MazE fold protein